MPNTPVINIVASKCRPDQEAKFNKWYNEIHIPMLMKIKGLKAVTRYKLANEDKNAATYITIYQFDSREDLDAYNKSPVLAEVREEMKQSWPDAGCWTVAWRAPYEELKVFKR
jgi:antibiotic biosynthesis monooxygenase (ABM) superfamily enzyme